MRARDRLGRGVGRATVCLTLLLGGPPAVAAQAEEPLFPALPAGSTSVVAPLSPALRARITGTSWRPGCPVGLDDLRVVMVTYTDFDGASRVGPLIVRRRVASAVASAFDDLARQGFPIRQIRLVDDYGADDDRSTMADNTSAFNCRRAEGSTHWSEHAFGQAIDINPLENPYVYADGHVLDPAARPFLDRSKLRLGMIGPNGIVVGAFRKIGWGWGGAWRGRVKDYQHVSVSGR